MKRHSEFSPDEQKKLDAFNDDIIKSSLITPDSIYIELPFFRDIYLGSILSLITTNAEYQYILKQMPKYSERAFNNIKVCFPDLPFSEEDVENNFYTKDPVLSNRIYRAAPATQFTIIFQNQISVNTNHSAVIGKVNPIKVTVNTYPSILSETNKHILGLFISHQYGVAADIVYIEPDKLTTEYLTQYDEIYTYFIKELLLVENIRQGFTDRKFIRKRFYAARIYSNEIVDVNIKNEDDINKANLDVLTDFMFIYPISFIPLYKDVLKK